MSPSPDLVLYQFAFSHYNEKVRWALDFKGLAAERHSLLPGLHERTVRRYTPEASTTPMLRDGDLAISGSAAILEHLEERSPEPPLFPAAAEEAKEVRRWIEWLDTEVGPAVRLAFFHEAFDDTALTGGIFTTGLLGLRSALYRWAVPLLVPMLRNRMSITQESAEKSWEIIQEGLRRVGEASGETGYLVGDRFSAADLTAAALFMPCFFPPQIPFALPVRPSECLDRWLARWREEPGAAYVARMWVTHRHGPRPQERS